ncbi:MAG: NYN domain-containing protein [Gemmatimonadetes bacterium]|nr:NYN domain-containing protein [Gemmatimonadota bacterium]
MWTARRCARFSRGLGPGRASIWQGAARRLSFKVFHGAAERCGNQEGSPGRSRSPEFGRAGPTRPNEAPRGFPRPVPSPAKRRRRGGGEVSRQDPERGTCFPFAACERLRTAMNKSFSRAPHIEGVTAAHSTHAPNAALLIDFDNVTMGMRSDLSRELKVLLNSDIIRGKVTVQRAYADWRRYPQYIVPLSEASIDLIFAPAYGSNKKNATDIRMAIDGMELVFTRPEIGTFILLTGDSDFSSLVLKLKEYGKYVVGVGIQESSSDILVQNCDEYYSYTSISGLRKTDEAGESATDPWVLVERAVEQMVKRNDVMRSDRLKQVMLEIDSGFDEKSLGFSKFSRFLSEASSKGLLRLQKMENGQYEIVSPSGGGRKTEERKESRRPERGRGDRPRAEDAERPRESRDGSRDGGSHRSEPAAPPTDGSAEPQPIRARGELEPAYDLLRKAVTALLAEQRSDSVRDSDVKRRMLVFDPRFDESEMGFSKFSRFLKQAHDHEVVTLVKGDDGNYQVSLSTDTASRGRRPERTAVSTGSPVAPAAQPNPAATQSPSQSHDSRPSPTPPAAPVARPAAGPIVPPAAPAEPAPEEQGSFWSRLLRPRDASRRRDAEGEPPLFEGQAIPGRKSGGVPSPAAESLVGAVGLGGTATARPAAGPVLDPASLHLPTGRESMVQYLTNSYAGIGERTAEALVSILGEELFVVLQKDPARVQAILPPARAEKVLEGWAADFERRKARHGGVPLEGAEATNASSPSDSEAALGAYRGRRTRSDG